MKQHKVKSGKRDRQNNRPATEVDCAADDRIQREMRTTASGLEITRIRLSSELNQQLVSGLTSIRHLR